MIIDLMDRRPLWRYYLLVNDEKMSCMYGCKIGYFHVNDMRWNMDNDDLDEKETCERA